MVALTSPDFKRRASRALGDARLQTALKRGGSGFHSKRAQAIAALPEFERLRDIGRDIKNHTLANLDHYLEVFERNVIANGGKVHWCADAAEARETVLRICRAADARTDIQRHPRRTLRLTSGVSSFWDSRSFRCRGSGSRWPSCPWRTFRRG